MERRTFLGVIAGGLLAAPLTAHGQQGPKVAKVGVLFGRAPTAENTHAVEQGLRDLGWIKDLNLTI
jgi:hypothetical protein